MSFPKVTRYRIDCFAFSRLIWFDLTWFNTSCWTAFWCWFCPFGAGWIPLTLLHYVFHQLGVTVLNTIILALSTHMRIEYILARPCGAHSTMILQRHQVSDLDHTLHAHRGWWYTWATYLIQGLKQPACGTYSVIGNRNTMVVPITLWFPDIAFSLVGNWLGVLSLSYY